MFILNETTSRTTDADNHAARKPQCRSYKFVFNSRHIYPFHQANTIRPIKPVPSLNTQVTAAANGVAVDSPTPILRMIECVARVPITEFENDLKFSNYNIK